MTDIGFRRELFLDDTLIDLSRTTAGEVLHRPVRRELVMTNDAPWEADGWVYYTVFEDGGLFRMYYLSMPMYNKDHTKHDPPFHHINYAQSTDGIRWEKPCLGIHAFEGSKKNNIIAITDTMDAFHVFRDDNPGARREERYKAVYTKPGHRLWCMVSEDGIHFREGWQLSGQGRFDSHNTAFWDAEASLYRCYFRDFHESGGAMVRDIRVMESEDFRVWTAPRRVEYGKDSPDFHMYTNGIQPYFRAPHQYIGFPARYTERPEWTANYDALCGAARRKYRMRFHPRFGLALTDGLFMASRDGLAFHRRDEAFLRPGPESGTRWVYGDGYAGHGLLCTAANGPGEDKELSLYVSVNHWSDTPVQLYRYTLRLDGFVSRSAGWAAKTLVTKPLRFSGDRLLINFATSAAGSVRIALEDASGSPIPGYASCALFGDSADRPVDFPAPLSALQGRPVRLCFTLQDADMYAYGFQR